MAIADILFSYRRDGFFAEHIRRDIPYQMPIEHYHAQYEIYYLVSGDRNIFIQDRICHVEAGDVVLLSPDVIHRSLPGSSTAHERLLIEFDLKFFEDILISPNTIPFRQVFHGKQSVFRPLEAEKLKLESDFLLLFAELKKRSPSSDFKIKLLFLSLLMTLDTIATVLPSDEFLSSSRAHRHIREIILYLQDNYQRDIGLESTAEHFCLSKEHCSRIFRQTTGFTLTSYLNQLRIRKAQQLLATTKDTIETTALACGFQGSTHFGRVFHAQTGMTPGAYRRSLPLK